MAFRDRVNGSSLQSERPNPSPYGRRPGSDIASRAGIGRPAALAAEGENPAALNPAAAANAERPAQEDIDRLMVAIIHSGDADKVNRALVEGGFGATRINAQGGFLKRGNAVFIVGIPNARGQALVETIRKNCARPGGTGSGGDSYGVLFVLKVAASDRI